MDRSQRIERIIREYDAQGWHRTGTAVDHESAQWLADLVSETGVDVSLEPFELSRIDPGECYLEVGGVTVQTGLDLMRQIDYKHGTTCECSWGFPGGID